MKITERNIRNKMQKTFQNTSNTKKCREADGLLCLLPPSPPRFAFVCVSRFCSFIFFLIFFGIAWVKNDTGFSLFHHRLSVNRLPNKENITGYNTGRLIKKNMKTRANDYRDKLSIKLEEETEKQWLVLHVVQ